MNAVPFPSKLKKIIFFMHANTIYRLNLDI